MDRHLYLMKAKITHNPDKLDRVRSFPRQNFATASIKINISSHIHPLEKKHVKIHTWERLITPGCCVTNEWKL